MFCARCDQPIGRDEETRTHDEPRPTGAGVTITVHAKSCKPTRQQTSPVK
jgi:hypothetical protein